MQNLVTWQKEQGSLHIEEDGMNGLVKRNQPKSALAYFNLCNTLNLCIYVTLLKMY